MKPIEQNHGGNNGEVNGKPWWEHQLLGKIQEINKEQKAKPEAKPDLTLTDVYLEWDQNLYDTIPTYNLLKYDRSTGMTLPLLNKDNTMATWSPDYKAWVKKHGVPIEGKTWSEKVDIVVKDVTSVFKSKKGGEK